MAESLRLESSWEPYWVRLSSSSSPFRSLRIWLRRSSRGDTARGSMRISSIMETLLYWVAAASPQARLRTVSAESPCVKAESRVLSVSSSVWTLALSEV